MRPGEARRSLTRCRNLAEQQHPGIKGCRGSVWHSEKLDPGRTRPCNLWFRSPAPYPLGHKTLHAKPRKVSHSRCGRDNPGSTPDEDISLGQGHAGRSRREKKNDGRGGVDPATLASAVVMLCWRSAASMDTLGIEPSAFCMRSRCDPTTPCAPCSRIELLTVCV